MEEKKHDKILIRILREISRCQKKTKTNRIKVKELYVNIQKRDKETENMGQISKEQQNNQGYPHQKQWALEGEIRKQMGRNKQNKTQEKFACWKKKGMSL